jgi:Xaa-Pro aminopeptidase
MTQGTLLNRPRALLYMEECGIDALIATSPVNVGYLSGYFCWLNSLLREYMVKPGGTGHLPEAYAILTRDGSVALVVNAVFSPDALRLGGVQVYIFGSAGVDLSALKQPAVGEEQLWALLTAADQSPDAPSALFAAMQDCGLSEGRIGVELDSFPPERARRLSDAMPRANFRDCTNLLRLVRAVKSQEEIRRLTRAAEISETAGRMALEQARTGSSMRELRQHYHARAAAMGAVFDHFAFSPHGLGISMSGDFDLGADDALYLDFGCKFDEYFSDTGLTLAMTGLSAPLGRRYAALQDALNAGMREMKPGARASTIHHAMEDAFAAHGFAYCFPHGHGLGLEVRDYPVLVPDSGLAIEDGCVEVPADLVMEEAMVNNLEACVFVPGAGSVHMEKTFLVTADGCRPLIPQERGQPFSPRGAGRGDSETFQSV